MYKDEGNKDFQNCELQKWFGFHQGNRMVKTEEK